MNQTMWPKELCDALAQAGFRNVGTEQERLYRHPVSRDELRAERTPRVGYRYFCTWTPPGDFGPEEYRTWDVQEAIFWLNVDKIGGG